MKKRILALLLAGVMVLLLAACGPFGPQEEPEEDPAVVEPDTEPEPESEPEPEPVSPYTNPLTGLPIDEDKVNDRPVAIMLNNIKVALPQCGVSQADIIYEVNAEGGITRMLAVYQDPSEVGNIGTVRSTRPYYLHLALGLDAILLHAGGSPAAYSDIKTLGVTNLDCLTGGLEGSLYWRDPTRRQKAGFEHSVFTSGERITAQLAKASFRKEHADGYSTGLTFVEDGTPAGGMTANTLSVYFSGYKTGVFTYDPDSRLYMIQEYGAPYVDGNTGDQVGVTNVLVLLTSESVLDSSGRLSVRMTGTGSGYYACGGSACQIQWSKSAANAPFQYTHTDGTPLDFGRGTTYVNIVQSGNSVSIS